MVLLMICYPLQPPEILFWGESVKMIIIKTHHTTLDSLKASMVAGFADIESKVGHSNSTTP